MNTLNIALFGFGTVGANVAKMIIQNQEKLSKELTTSFDKINLKYIAVRDKSSSMQKLKSNTQELSKLFTENHDDIWNDKEINCVIELIGGTGIAKDIIYKAVETNKNVITANKAVLADCGNELFALAKQHNVTIGFEASVAGGIPIIQTLKKHMSIGKIESIEGILNGTCNYMLSNLENNPALSYADALRDAQEKGFAESDPSADVDGWDTAAKIAILSGLCFTTDIPKMTDFSVTGISKITSAHISNAKAQKKKIRLIASAKKIKNRIEISVSPQEITESSPFYSVNGPDNMVIVQHEYLGELVLKGAGAGGEATAISIISDIINL